MIEKRDLRITVLCHETPYPPSHGGRADMWRRLVAMSKNGVQIQLISWDYGALTPDRAMAINDIVVDHQYIPLQRTLAFRARHIFGILRYPWFANIRWPGPFLPLITKSVEEFRPDLLFLDGWHGALLAFHLSDALTLPIYYRSHNIEHEYIRSQHKHATTLRSRLVTYVAGLHLKSLEYQIMDSAAMVYDISMDDMKYWNAHGYHHIKYLPPIYSTEVAQISAAPSVIYDLVFLGNLHAHNNIAGVTWLLEKVMPIVWRERSDTTLLIAGSNPNLQFREHLSQINNVNLIVNPPDANKVLAKGRIALNPVETAGGVQIKNIDMLLSGRPIITRSAGVTGLPYCVRKCFSIADSAPEFASEILSLLANPPHLCDGAMLNTYFGNEKIVNFLRDVEDSLLLSKCKLAT